MGGASKDGSLLSRAPEIHGEGAYVFHLCAKELFICKREEFGDQLDCAPSASYSTTQEFAEGSHPPTSEDVVDPRPCCADNDATDRSTLPLAAASGNTERQHSDGKRDGSSNINIHERVGPRTPLCQYPGASRERLQFTGAFDAPARRYMVAVLVCGIMMCLAFLSRAIALPLALTYHYDEACVTEDGILGDYAHFFFYGNSLSALVTVPMCALLLWSSKISMKVLLVHTGLWLQHRPSLPVFAILRVAFGTPTGLHPLSPVSSALSILIFPCVDLSSLLAPPSNIVRSTVLIIMIEEVLNYIGTVLPRCGDSPGSLAAIMVTLGYTATNLGFLLELNLILGRKFLNPRLPFIQFDPSRMYGGIWNIPRISQRKSRPTVKAEPDWDEGVAEDGGSVKDGREMQLTGDTGRVSSLDDNSDHDDTAMVDFGINFFQITRRARGTAGTDKPSIEMGDMGNKVRPTGQSSWYTPLDILKIRGYDPTENNKKVYSFMLKPVPSRFRWAVIVVAFVSGVMACLASVCYLVGLRAQPELLCFERIPELFDLNEYYFFYALAIMVTLMAAMFAMLIVRVGCSVPILIGYTKLFVQSHVTLISFSIVRSILGPISGINLFAPLSSVFLSVVPIISDLGVMLQLPHWVYRFSFAAMSLTPLASFVWLNVPICGQDAQTNLLQSVALALYRFSNLGTTIELSYILARKATDQHSPSLELELSPFLDVPLLDWESGKQAATDSRPFGERGRVVSVEL